MRFSFIAGIVLALSVAGVVLTPLGDCCQQREHLADQIVDMRESGLLPASEHAVPEESAAYHERLDALQRTLPHIRDLDSAYEIVDLETAAELLVPHEETLDELEDLILRPDGPAAALERRGQTAKQPTLMRSQGTVNVLCTRAVVAASEGRGADALRTLTAALDFSYTLDRPCWITLMVEYSLDSLVAKTWQRIDREFGHQLGARDFADALGPRFERACGPERVVASMRGELTSLLSYVEEDGVLSEMDTTMSDLGLHVLGHYRASLEDPGACKHGPAGKAQDCDSKCISIHQSTQYNVRGYQLTRLALAIGAHRVRTGDWPVALEELELAGAPAVDPCLGTPFRYEVGVDEVRLWSEDPPPGVTVCGRNPGQVNVLLDWRWKR